MKKVSIIIPVYNGEKTIEQTLISAVGQTYPQVEIIVINDGSQDQTKVLCEQMAATYPRIKVITQENAGVSAARNRGLEEADGTYIAFLDADDSMDASFCELMVGKMESEKAQMVVCGFYSESIEEIKAWQPGQWEGLQEICRGLIETVGMNCLWNKLFLKEKIQSKFNTRKTMGEDLEFICNYITGIEKIALVSACLYHYQRDNQASLSHTVKMTPLQILEEYEGLKCFCTQLQVQISGFTNRLIFSTCYKLRSEKYSVFRRKWKQFRRQEGFTQLIEAYEPMGYSYKIMAVLIRYNMSFLVYLIMKVKL